MFAVKHFCGCRQTWFFAGKQMFAIHHQFLTPKTIINLILESECFLIAFKVSKVVVKMPPGQFFIFEGERKLNGIVNGDCICLEVQEM